MQTASRLPSLSVFAALGWFALIQGIALLLTRGYFEYPLDDVYIHLAMAEQIAAGGYGVNPGEYASAASSPLYPLLLLFQPGSEVQRILPLVWNTVGLIASAWIWGHLMVRANLQGPWAVALAVLTPLSLNFAGVAFVGMEHALHLAASLAVLLGGVVLIEDKRVSWILVLGIALCPVLRFEGLALALVGVGLVAVSGRIVVATGLLALAIIPLVAFGWYLTTLGLDPFPNSIQAKLETSDLADESRLTKTIFAILTNIQFWGGMSLMLGTVALLLSFRLAKWSAIRPYALVFLGVALAALAHLVLGRIGWMHRYEIYILATLTGALMLALSKWNSAKAAGVTLVWVVGAGALYVQELMWENITNPRTIHLQQHQMARLAQDFAKTKVAVNDLGWVAWSNPNYVLDLWGLASNEAREARIFNPVDGWAGDLTRAQDVPLVMVYNHWIDEGLSDDWVPLGGLVVKEYTAFIGSPVVHFYASDAQYVDQLNAALAEWAPTLPQGVEWVFEKDKQG